MSSHEKDSVPSAITEMSNAELEAFHVSGRVQCKESTINYNRAREATLSNPEDRVTDEETMNTRLALPDELLAKVLGYLPLRDRFRLETVCRQWQRCMYLEVECLHLWFFPEVDQQYTLTIINLGKITCLCTEEVPAVLRKLRRSKVDHLKFGIDGKILDKRLFYLIADIASKATNVVLDYCITFRPANLVTLSDIIGPHITTFHLISHCEHAFFEDFKAFAYSLVRMKRLKNVTTNWLGLIFTCLNSLPTNSLPHFQEIVLMFCAECHWKLWEHFKSLYEAQIKKIKFDSDPLLHDEGEVLSLWKDLTPFSNLRHLDFAFCLDDCNWTALTEALDVISISCPHLTSLGLHQVLLSKRFVTTLMDVQKLFVAIGKIKLLEKLDLEFVFCFNDSRDISWEENLDLFILLENKSNITHLKSNVILCLVSTPARPIDCGIFLSLNNAMPNLRHLDICCTSNELDHFVGLNRMQTISLYYYHSEKASGSVQDGLIRILKSNPALRSITIHRMLSQVSEVLIGAIMEVAELQMEKHIDFIAKIAVKNRFQKAWEAMKCFAPRNLTLIFYDNYY